VGLYNSLMCRIK